MTDTETQISCLVYVAGPIDDVEGADRTWWRDSLQHILKEAGVAAYNPLGAFFQDADSLKANAALVCQINRAALFACDAMIVYLGGKGRAFGTIREVEFARAQGKPVFVICDGLKSLEANDVTIVPNDLVLDTKRDNIMWWEDNLPFRK